MSDPIKIRARSKGDHVEIRLLIPHPMESGRRKDAGGQPIPACFIQSLTVDVAGRRVIEAQLSGSVSRDPYFVFKVDGAKPGDTVSVRWQDNTGETRTAEAVIA